MYWNRAIALFLIRQLGEPFMSFFRQPNGKRAVLAALVVTLGYSLASCSESKVSQCNRLVKVANEAVSAVEKVTETATPASANNVESMQKIATAASDANQQMTGLTVSDPKLQEFKNKFVKMYTSTQAATQKLIDAAKDKNSGAAETAFKELQQATSEEEPLVRDVNSYCGSN
jgi:hypothetical protein